MTTTLTFRVAIGALVLGACADTRDARRSDTARTEATANVVATSPAAPVPRSPAVPAVRHASTVKAEAPTPVPSGPRRVTFAGLDFTGVGHDRGDPRAPVVLMDLSDFGCPYCGEFSRETYPVIEREYVRTGKVYFKYVPFIVGSFPHSREATRGAECAAEQGKFWEMLDRVYATQAEWRRGNAIDAQVAALAGTIPVDSARFADCYRDRRTDGRTARATELANQLGVRVTPSFLVNDRPVQGALAIAGFRTVIEAALLVARTQH